MVAAVVVGDGDGDGDDVDVDVDSVVFFLTNTIPAAILGLMKMSEKEFGVTLMTLSVTASLLRTPFSSSVLLYIELSV